MGSPTKLVNARIPVDVLARFDAELAHRKQTRTDALVKYMVSQAATWAEKREKAAES